MRSAAPNAAQSCPRGRGNPRPATRPPNTGCPSPLILHSSFFTLHFFKVFRHRVQRKEERVGHPATDLADQLAGEGHERRLIRRVGALADAETRTVAKTESVGEGADATKNAVNMVNALFIDSFKALSLSVLIVSHPSKKLTFIDLIYVRKDKNLSSNFEEYLLSFTCFPT